MRSEALSLAPAWRRGGALFPPPPPRPPPQSPPPSPPSPQGAAGLCLGRRRRRRGSIVPSARRAGAGRFVGSGPGAAGYQGVSGCRRVASGAAEMRRTAWQEVGVQRSGEVAVVGGPPAAGGSGATRLGRGAAGGDLGLASRSRIWVCRAQPGRPWWFDTGLPRRFCRSAGSDLAASGPARRIMVVVLGSLFAPR